jgi:hypothetical protein
MTSEVKKAYDDIGQKPEISAMINGYGKKGKTRGLGILFKIEGWTSGCLLVRGKSTQLQK